MTATIQTPPLTSRAEAVEAPQMRVIAYDRYGGFEELKLLEVETPAVRADEVLVRVRAAGLHIGDCFCVRGAPFLVRLSTGLLKPKRGVPGFDLAGEVAAVGKNVTQFQPGDEVFGECSGSCSEYVVVKPDKIALKPKSLSFEQAAAIPTSALAALHALRDVAKIRAGDNVLINGASGGVGTFAVQIAKSYGAKVTGVCSTKNVDMVRSLGADEVIDYTRDDFTKGKPRYDSIFDNVENHSLSDCRRTLKPTGTLIFNSGTGAHGIAMLLRVLRPLVLSPFVRQKLRRYLSVPNQADLVMLGQMVESGQLQPLIDRMYSLSKVPVALAYIEEGHARGKVVVSL